MPSKLGKLYYFECMYGENSRKSFKTKSEQEDHTDKFLKKIEDSKEIKVIEKNEI